MAQLAAQDDFSLAPVSVPMAPTFQLPPLYRVSANGKIWAWTIGFDGEQLLMCWETLENFQQGLIQSSTRRVDVNSRSVSLYEQALQEARHEHKNKKDKQGYGEQLIEHNIFTMGAMLCTTWDPQKNQIRRWPVWLQPKLDGCRCRAHFIPGETPYVQLVSRATQVINHLNHIREEYYRFNQIAMEYISQIRPDISNLCRADGELYSHELEFDQISGITRLVNTVSPVEGLVKYYIFDLIAMIPATFDERHALLTEVYNRHITAQGGVKYLHILPTYPVYSKEEILAGHNYFVSQGYEGVIIRKVGGRTEKERQESYYKGTRATAVYKFKMFQDSEGYVIGAEDGKGREEGAVIWTVQDLTGNQFSVRPRGDIDRRKMIYQHYLQNPQSYLGQKYRYRYQDLTQDGKPRFPVGVGFVYDR